MADDREELLALGAAGALTPEEAAELERLLAADPEAAAEYAAMLEDITVLADSVAEEPPTRLRAAVLEAVAAEPRIGADAPPPGEPADAAPPPPPPARPSPRSCRSTAGGGGSPPRRWRRRSFSSSARSS